LHPLRKQTIVMSILLDIDPDGDMNHHFQIPIDQWQKVYDQNESNCNQQNQNMRRIFTTDVMPADSSNPMKDLFENQTPIFKTLNSTHRTLKDTTPYGKGGWDPFHPSLERVRFHQQFLPIYYVYLFNTFIQTLNHTRHRVSITGAIGVVSQNRLAAPL
jgi:hypothetical protein